MKGFVGWLTVFLGLGMIAAPTAAEGPSNVTASIDHGIAWLTAEQSGDGVWGRQPDIPASAFAAQALRAAGQDVILDVAALASHDLSEAGGIALQLLGARDSALLSQLQARRNPDGSYGDNEGEKITTTGLALLAETLAGGSDSLAASYLSGRQGAGGAWGNGTSADETGLVMLALLTSGESGQVTADGLAWLERNQSPEGDWGTVHGAAWALLALTEHGGPAGARESAVRYLLGRQQSDGGFARRSPGTSEVTTTGLVTWSLIESGASFSGLDAAIAFLVAHRNADAGWYRNEPAVIDTTAVLDTFHTLSRSDSSTALAVLWILQRETPNNDFLARRLGSLARFGNLSEVDLNLLLSRQQADGGWGVADGYETTILDTVLAIDATYGADYYDPATLNRATGYLVNAQRADGSWGLTTQDDAGSLWATALAMQALKHYRTVFDLETAIAAGRAYLEAQQLADGGWGDGGTSTVWESALAFSAGMKAGLATAAAESGVAYLLGEQLADGSWNDDPYDTALALRALVESKPNLKITDHDISFSAPGGTDGDVITVTALIQNTGGFAIDGATAQVFLGDPHQGGVAIGGELLIPSLGPGASVTLEQVWDTTGLGGDKNVYVLLDPAGLVEEGNEYDNKAVNRFRVSTKADLALGPDSITYTQVDTPTTVQVTFTVIILNVGETAAENVRLAFYRGDPSDPSSDKTVTDPVTVPAGGAQPVSIYTELGTDQYDFTAIVDPDGLVDESNESNNSASISLQLGTRIDLVVSSVSLSDDDPAQGDVIQAWAEIYNANSFDDAQDVDVGFYLNGTPGYVPAEAVVNIPFLAAGRTVTAGPIDIPTMALPPEENILVVEVDPDNHIAEADEINNRYQKRFSVLSLPDLIMGNEILTFHVGSAANPPVTTVPRGTSVTILAPLSNAGAQDAHDVVFRLYNGNPLAGSVQIGEDLLAELVRYRSGPLSGVVSDADPTPYTTFMTATFDTTGMATGSYPIYGWIDPDNAVLEPDDANNLGYSVLEIGDEADPAPKAGAFTVSNPYPEEGDEVTISGVIENRTATPAPEVKIRIWDGHPQTDPPVLYEETFSVGGLAKHAFSFPWSTDLEQGEHTFYLRVDPDDEVVELDESNNEDTLSFEVVAATTPDLVVTRGDLSFDPPTVALGEAVTIRAEVSNLRRLAAHDVAVRFLRVDPAAGEVPIGTDQILAEIGGLGSGTAEVSFDTSVLTGSALVLVKVDPQNLIDERDETNNVATTVLRLGLADASRPTNVEATVDLTDVYLSWDDSTDPAVVGYDVERGGELINPDWQEWARRPSTTATASSFSVQDQSAELGDITNDAASAIDGTRFSYWESRSTTEPAWLAVDFGRPVLLTAVVVVWHERAEDYRLEAWNGFEWVTVLDVRGNEDSVTYHVLEQPADTDRLRIFVPLNEQGSRPRVGISEIRAHTLKPVE